MSFVDWLYIPTIQSRWTAPVKEAESHQAKSMFLFIAGDCDESLLNLSSPKSCLGVQPIESPWTSTQGGFVPCPMLLGSLFSFRYTIDEVLSHQIVPPRLAFLLCHIFISFNNLVSSCCLTKKIYEVKLCHFEARKFLESFTGLSGNTVMPWNPEWGL